MSGAQKVTLYQIDQLKYKYNISVFSLKEPEQHLLSKEINVIGEEIWKMYSHFGSSLKSVIFDKRITFLQKYIRIKYAVFSKLKLVENYIKILLGDKLTNVFENFDIVIVVSEASKLRELVGELKNPKKIQWIHTDYIKWSEFSSWTKDITKNDAFLYKKFNNIVLLSEFSKKNMADKYPHLNDKMVVIPNLILGEDILNKSKEDSDIKLSKSCINLITVGRLEKEKNYDGILDICKMLKSDAIEYKWYIVGSGNLRKHLESRIKSEDLSDRVTLLGNLDNPISIMKKCDWFVLLSDYEGTPVTIDEAKVIGLPVIALDRGGIKEQLMDAYGILLQDEGDIYRKFVQGVIMKNHIQGGYNYVNSNLEIKVKLDELYKETCS